MDRREFLKTSGALDVSFTVPAADVLAQSGKPPLVPGELDSWIAVLPNGNVQAFFPEANPLLAPARREPISGVPDYNAVVEGIPV